MNLFENIKQHLGLPIGCWNTNDVIQFLEIIGINEPRIKDNFKNMQI